MRYPENEVAAMKERLAERMEQRRLERDICQVICVVKHVPFQRSREAVAVQEPGAGERLERRPIVGFEDLKRVATGSWMVAMTLAVILFLSYGMRMV